VAYKTQTGVIPMTRKEYTFNIARSIEEVESFRSIWEAFVSNQTENHPNAEIDYYFSVVSNMEKALYPFVILCSQNNVPVALTIGRIDAEKMKFKIGYKTLFAAKVRCLKIVYSGVLGKSTEEISALLINELLRILRKDEFDVVLFNGLRSDSNLFKSARIIPNLLCRDYCCVTQKHWRMKIPGSIEAYYEGLSKRNRSNIRTYSRKLSKSFSGNVKIECFRDIDQVDALMYDTEEIAKTTYQRGLRVGFVRNQLTQSRMSVAAEKGWLRAYVLYISDNPVAFQLGFHYGNTYFVAGKGYNPKFRKFRVGNYLFVKMVEEFCGNSSIKYFDFGLGDAEYKQMHGHQYWKECSLYLFSSNPKGFFLNLVRTTLFFLNRNAELVLHRFRFVNPLKLRWRKSLIAKL
jgi:hypothetical protein